MAGDVTLKPESLNPCCAELKKEVLEKEEKRRALRKAVKLLNQEIERMQSDNAKLKKVNEEERLRTELEKEAKEKEINDRVHLEKQIDDLNNKISFYQQRESSRITTEEHNELLSRTSAQEVEIKRLETLLMKEKRRGDSEKKNAEVEKKKAAEDRKLLEMEKSKAEKERKLAETERKKCEELALSLARLKTEINQVRDELIKERSKVHDLEISIEQEKQKTIRKRKHVDLEQAKMEEKSKILEVERKKAMDEKAQIDLLKQQLEGEMQKRVEYERKLLKMIHTKDVAEKNSCFADERSQTDSSNKSKVKLLRKELKLEKKRVKHFKRKAKFEKAEKIRISQLFHLQEHNTVKISHHLKLLGDQLSQSIEDTNNLAKVQSSYNLDLDLQPMKFGPRPSEADFLLTNSCNSSGCKRQCIGFNLSGGNCIRQLYSAKPELQSVSKGSVRNKPPSSAVCSATTTLSNINFVNSQRRDAALVVSESKLPENFLRQKPKKPRCPREVAKNIQNEGVLSKANKRRKGNVAESTDNENPNTSICQGNKDSSQQIDDRECVDDEHNQLHLEKGEKLLGHKDLMASKGGMPMEIFSQNYCISRSSDNERDLQTEMLDDVGRKRVKILTCQEDEGQTLAPKKGTSNKNGKLGSKGSVLPFSFKPLLVDDQMSKGLHTCREDTYNSIDTQCPDLVSFENMILGGCTKLLELDNSGDEKRFKEAIERPLSPTLPGIPEEHIREYCSHYVGDMLSEKCEIERITVRPCQAFDVIDLEISSNKLEVEVPIATTHIANDDIGSFHASEKSNCRNAPTPQGDIDRFLDGEKICAAMDSITSTDFVPSVKKFNELNLQAECGLHCLVDSYNSPMLDSSDNVLVKENNNPLLPGLDKSEVNGFALHGGHQLLDSETKTFPNAEGSFLGSAKASEVTMCSMSGPSLIVEHNKHSPSCCMLVEAPKHFFVLSDTKNEHSISRIVQSSKKLTTGRLMKSQRDCFLAEVLDGLSLEVNLQPQERISVIFSLLLCHFSGTIFTSSRSFKAEDILLFSRSFMAEIHTGFADEAIRLLFLDACPIDILLNLIEDFLIERRILMCDDLESVQTCPSISPVATYNLKGENMFVIETIARVDELIAASIMLASFCVEFDEIDFLVGASYKILRMCKNDVSFNLLALHVFESVCGDKFFAAEKYNSLTAIKSVVCYLEREYSSHLRSTSGIAVCFQPCVQCPFSDGAIGMEDLVSSLITMLEDSALTGNCVVSSVYTVPDSLRTKEEKTCHPSGHEGLDAACDTSCLLFKYNKHGDDTFDSTPKRVFCWFTDVISIVELFGYYMSWSWMYDNVLLRLLKIISLCPSDEYAAAIVLLVGQIGRVGIDFGGYEQIGIKELLCSLSDFLDTCTRIKSSLPKQLAIVGALIDLLPFKFREIVDGHLEHSLDINHSCQIKLLKEWFSQLSDRQQFLALNLFKDEPQ